MYASKRKGRSAIYSSTTLSSKIHHIVVSEGYRSSPRFPTEAIQSSTSRTTISYEVFLQ